MIQRVIDVVAFLLYAVIGTPGGVLMTLAGTVLVAFRLMIRDKPDQVRPASLP
jgi:hypothetical protein